MEGESLNTPIDHVDSNNIHEEVKTYDLSGAMDTLTKYGIEIPMNIDLTNVKNSKLNFVCSDGRKVTINGKLGLIKITDEVQGNSAPVVNVFGDSVSVNNSKGESIQPQSLSSEQRASQAMSLAYMKNFIEADERNLIGAYSLLKSNEFLNSNENSFAESLISLVDTINGFIKGLISPEELKNLSPEERGFVTAAAAAVNVLAVDSSKENINKANEAISKVTNGVIKARLENALSKHTQNRGAVSMPKVLDLGASNKEKRAA